jgi:ABC-type Co2+ transport system permease subunit
MRDLLKRFSSRRDYRLASLALVALLVAIVLGTLLIPADTPHPNLWGLLAVFLGLPCYVVLAWLTYYRLQRAGVSTAWLFLLVITIDIGPK